MINGALDIYINLHWDKTILSQGGFLNKCHSHSYFTDFSLMSQSVVSDIFNLTDHSHM